MNAHEPSAARFHRAGHGPRSSELDGVGDAKATLMLAALEFARRRLKPEGAKKRGVVQFLVGHRGPTLRPRLLFHDLAIAQQPRGHRIRPLTPRRSFTIIDVSCGQIAIGP